MTAKAIFVKEELAKWWVAICRDPKFAMVQTFARAEAMELGMSQEQMRGADLMLNILVTLPDNADTPSKFPSPGLHHKTPAPEPLKPE